jgi:hypothetical protein
VKRAAAAVVAVLMIIGAVLVRRGMDDTKQEAERVRVLCAQIIADACTEWARTTNITVTAMDLTKAKAKDVAAFSLVIGPPAVLPDTGVAPTIVAHSPVVIVSRLDDPFCADGSLGCLTTLKAPVSIQVQRTGEIGKQLLAAVRGAISDENVIDVLLSSGVDSTNDITIGQMGSVHVPNVAVMAQVSVGAAPQLRAAPAKPAVRVDLGAALATDAPAAAAALIGDQRLSASLTAAGWQPG